MSGKNFLLLAAALALMVVASVTAKAHPPTGIVVDRQGQVYFSDLETVWRLGLDGKLSVFRPAVRGRHTHELSIDAQDNIYGADVSYAPATQKWISAVWKMTPEGKLTWLQEASDHPAPGISIWLDRPGNMYSIDQNNHSKTQTLLLRRTPDGLVSTFAGGAYGHADGKGTLARFSSIGGIAFGPNGVIYLSDAASVRKVFGDGAVTTLAKDLGFRTADDQPTLFGGSSSSLTGLTVDSDGNVYAADAGNRRLLKIGSDGKVSVFYRTAPPYFPNGVFVTPSGDLFVLEIGFTLPNVWSGPRVRKFSRDGQNILLTTIGAEAAGSVRASIATALGVSVEGALQFFVQHWVAFLVMLFVGLLTGSVMLLLRLSRRSRRSRHT